MIKRPLAVFGLLYMAMSALAVCFIADVNFTVAFMAALIGCAACFFAKEHRRDIVIVWLPVFLAFFVMGHFRAQAENISQTLGTQTCTLSGVVTEMPRRQYGRWYYIIKTDAIGIDGAKQKMKIRLTCRHSLEAREGDRILCTVTFVQNHDETGYDSETALRADGVAARAWCSPYQTQTVIPGNAFSLRYTHIALRRQIIAAIRRALPSRASALLCAMLLGDTDYLDDSVIDSFRAAGIAHLLAVSGLHVSLLTYAVSQLLRKLRFSPRANTFASILFILLFMAVTGFSPSVTRAGMMHLIALLSRFILRDPDNVTSLSVSVLVICFLNPWSAADIGLQLSVCSTLGLLLAADRIQQSVTSRFSFDRRRGWLPRIRSYVADSLAVSVTASLSTLPLSACYFGRVSLIAPLTNLLCVYVATWFLLIGLLASLLYAVPPVGWLLSLPLRLAAVLLDGYLERTTSFLAKLPLAVLNTSYPYIPLFLMFAAAIAAAALLGARRATQSAHRQSALCNGCCWVCVLLFVSMLSHLVTCTGNVITVFAMQDGGVCVYAKNGTHAMIAEAGGDSYDLRTVEDDLSSNGVRKIDAVAASSPASSRSRLTDELIAAYAPDYFLCGETPFAYPYAQKAARKSGTRTVDFGNGITLNALSLRMNTYTDSDGKGWERLQCGGVTALVCPDDGDCALLPDDYLTCDAVIVGNDLKNITRLTTGAVILTAEWDEAAQTACRLYVKGFRHVYMTERDGTVTFTVKRGKLYIKTTQ